ncbi:hypothetical protein ACWE42_11405 [Sutcliffiella cohnii]
MNNIIEEMKELYLKDLKPWVVSVSFGKDSSLCLEYTFQMLGRLLPHQRKKTVHVIMVNTLVETPMMSDFMMKSIRKVQEVADAKGLPIIAKAVVPELKDRFFYNTLGKGLLVISPKAKGRWCTHRMKINPAQSMIRDIIANSPHETGVDFSYTEDGQLAMLEQDTTRVVQVIGTRLDESAARAASIRSHEFSADTKFSRHAYFKDDVLCYMPIKYLTNDEVFLSLPERFSWGIAASELEVQYGQDFLECGLQDAGENKNACGVGSRQGCFTCPAMGLNKDKMMEGLISEGFTKLIPLYEWKKQLIEMRNDVRYREFERRQWRKQHQKRLTASEERKEQVQLIGQYFDRSHDVSDFYKMKKQFDYDGFDRAEDYEYLPGGLSVEGRRLMLEKLLYIQVETGYNLISEEEVQAIIEYWNVEGYEINRKDVRPTNHSYDGALVLKKCGSINLKETSTVTPSFEVSIDFEYGRDEMVEFIESRKKETGQSYYYFTTHCDLGEKEQFVWNQAVFIVCRPGINTEEEAKQLIIDWLEPESNRQKEDHSFSGYVKRKWNKVKQLRHNGEEFIYELTLLKNAYRLLKEDNHLLYQEIKTFLISYEEEISI